MKTKRDDDSSTVLAPPSEKPEATSLERAKEGSFPYCLALSTGVGAILAVATIAFCAKHGIGQ